MSTNSRQPAYQIDPRFIARWSRRSFTGEAVTEQQMFTLFEAARWAPSSSNSQPWRFVYGITGTPAFQTILDGLVERNQQWARKAGALIAVISSPTFTRPDGTSAESRSHSFDTGAAWAMIALQANVMGLSTRGMGGIDVKKLQTSLNVPEAYRIEAVVAVGHPGTVELLPEDFQSQEKPTQRNPQSAFVFEGTFKS